MDGAGVITIGPIIATHGAFYLRPLTLNTTEHGPRQLPFYLITLRSPLHQEIAYTLTEDLDTGKESVVRSVLDQLRQEVERRHDQAIERWRARKRAASNTTATIGEAERALERPAEVEAQKAHEREAERQRQEWFYQAILAVSALSAGIALAQDESAAHAPPLVPPQGTEPQIVPQVEETVLARFVAFFVRQTMTARMWAFDLRIQLRFPSASWQQPWQVEQLVHAALCCDGVAMERVIYPSQMPENGVTRDQVIEMARSWVSSLRYNQALDNERQRLQAKYLGKTDATSDYPDSYRKLEHDLPVLTAALEALEAEDARERAEHEGTDKG